uniref:Uncharacterized protein n=1 Tax=Trichobilharzia regenti TaxID=157069 RepID=A0AA85KRU1_TRIRE|nr:unnamed protein product [Trichobilharzia regenti]
MKGLLLYFIQRYPLLQLHRLSKWNTRLAQVQHRPNMNAILVSISYSEQFYIVKNVTKHNPSRNCADSKMKFNPKSEKRRFFYYATPVLILAYFLYWRKS